jgi:hypothetical protein
MQIAADIFWTSVLPHRSSNGLVIALNPNPFEFIPILSVVAGAMQGKSYEL